MNLLQEIDAQIDETKNIISKKYPHHCIHCHGRGGEVRDWYEGTRKFIMCKVCVAKGLDPLNTNLKLVQPRKYGLYYYEDGWMCEAWWDHDDNDNYISPTNNLELGDEVAWQGTEMDLCDHLHEIKEKALRLQNEYEVLVGRTGNASLQK